MLDMSHAAQTIERLARESERLKIRVEELEAENEKLRQLLKDNP